MMSYALLIAFGMYKQTWLNDRSAYWFSTPEAWNIDDPSVFRAMMYQKIKSDLEVMNEVDSINN
jgi:hypothetical protein